MNQISENIIFTGKIDHIILKTGDINFNRRSRKHSDNSSFQSVKIHIDERDNRVIRACAGPVALLSLIHIFCGKRPETAALQDLLIWTTKGLSAVTTQLRREGKTVDASVNHLITENLFTTITNVNFDDDTIRARIEATLETKALLAQLADCSALPEAALWNGTTDEFAAKAVTVGVLSTENEDIRSLRELITYGLKGLAAYTSHANVLLKENEEIDAFLQRALAATLDDCLLYTSRCV